MNLGRFHESKNNLFPDNNTRSVSGFSTFIVFGKFTDNTKYIGAETIRNLFVFIRLITRSKCNLIPPTLPEDHKRQKGVFSV